MPHPPKCTFWLRFYLICTWYSSNSFRCSFPSCIAARPSSLFCLLAVLWSSALCPSHVSSVLPSFSLVVLWFLACVALWGSWDGAGFVFLLFRLVVSLVLLLSSLCLCGPCCFLCCLPSCFVVPFSVLPAFPPPRVVWFVLWSSLHPGVLVPPSGYRVAAVTAQLPCFYARSMVELCYPSVIRFMATKASGPVWGFHPLHHVTGDVREPSLAILRYSS